MNKIYDLIEARLAAKLDAVIEGAIERRLRALLGADEAEAKPKKPGARESKARPSTRGVTRARWGPDEVETLRRGLASGSTVDQIGRALGRSAKAVTRKALRLGLDPVAAEARARKAWADDEDRRLERLHAEGRTHAEIAVRLGRPKHAIAQRCSAFGLVRGGAS